MALFKRKAKARDKPQDRTAGSQYTFYMGGTVAGKAVTERSNANDCSLFMCSYFG